MPETRDEPPESPPRRMALEPLDELPDDELPEDEPEDVLDPPLDPLEPRDDPLDPEGGAERTG